MDNNMIRFGVVGTSFIADWVLTNAKTIKEFSLEAVYSRSDKKAKEFADKHGATYHFNDLNEMAKSDLIDAVYIASPNSLHAEQSKLFLENGKHVLCEKAFASNVLEANEVIDLARQNNLIVMEAMVTTQLPNFYSVKKNLHKIGKVRKIFASYCQYSSRYDKYKEGIVLNAFNPAFSNGSLMDIGVYCLHPIINLFGSPTSISANAIMLASGIDGEGSILLRYDDMEGIVTYSKISNSYIPSEIQGEKGSMIINKFNNFADVKIIYRDGSEESISTHQSEYSYSYEIIKFIELINNKDIEGRDFLLAVTKDVMTTMDEARRQIGLVFPADKNGDIK